MDKSILSDARNKMVSLSFSRTLVYATVFADPLDATDGVVFFGLHGLNPIHVLQYITSGLLGAASFRGGLATAGLGVHVYFCIALASRGECPSLSDAGEYVATRKTALMRK